MKKNKKVTVSWESRIYPQPDSKLLLQFCTLAAEVAGLPLSGGNYLPVSFLDSKEMTEINVRHLGHEGDTDVITFDYRNEFPAMDNDPEPMGEIVVCPTVAARQAKGRKNRYYSREVALYVVHGILHLCGDDDMSPAPRARMRRHEHAVMSKLESHFNWNTLFPESGKNENSEPEATKKEKN